MCSSSKITTKLNFMLIILLLFFTFITNVCVYIYVSMYVYIHFICFQLGNNGIIVFGSFCNLFPSPLCFGDSSLFHFHCCRLIHCRNILEFNCLFNFCIFGLFPVFFATNSPVYVSLINMCNSFSRVCHLRVKLVGRRI